MILNGEKLMEFGKLISRADDEILQVLLGSASVRLIMLLDQTHATPTRLRELLLSLRKPEDLLLDSSSRALLMELLRESEANLLAEALGLDYGEDVYSALKDLKVQRGSQRERILFEFFELYPPQYELHAPVPTEQSSACGYGLFPYQREAIKKVKSYLNQQPYRVLLHMPTGSGKTRTAMHVIADHLRDYEPTVVVWLAHSEELCEQAASEFKRAWSYLGNREVALYRFWGSHNLNLCDVHDGLVVAGLSKVFNFIKREGGIDFISTLGSRTTLIIMDEAHQAIAETYKLILDTLFNLGHKTALLGLTATPGRTWDDITADQELADFFNRRKVTLSISGYDNPVKFLMDEGYIAQVTFKPLLTNSGIELTPQDLKYLAEQLDVPKRVLEEISENDKRNLAIVLAVEKLARRHKRIIVFAASVQHSKTLACALRSRGIIADSLTGTTPPLERSRLINEFKKVDDDTRVLCNFGVLTTGFDAPITSAVVIARPTISLVLYSQMVGRAIRGPKAGGNENAEVVTVVDHDLPGFRAVAEAFNNWEDVWKEE